MIGVTVVSETIADLDSFLDRLPDITRTAARIAINDTANGPALALAKKTMQAQVAFPAGYLNADRIAVTQPATDSTLQATITGRDRPTSLARFATPGATPQSTHSKTENAAGLAVMVKPGQPRQMNRAFLVRLNRGVGMTGDSFNVGLAIRLKPGEVIQNKREFSAYRLSDNVFLLYGPSVNQVFADAAQTISPSIAEQVATEFARQFLRLSEGTS